MSRTLGETLKIFGYIPTEDRAGKKILIRRKDGSEYELHEPELLMVDFFGNHADNLNEGEGLAYQLAFKAWDIKKKEFVRVNIGDCLDDEVVGIDV